MLTLQSGSACDVCAEEYGPQCLPHSIPCGESFGNFFNRAKISKRTRPVRELLQYHSRKDTLTPLPRLPFLPRKFLR